MLHSINYCMCVFLKFICIYFFLYYRGPCVRKLFTGLIMYLPSQNKEDCIVLYLSEATHDCGVCNSLKCVFTSLTQEFKGKKCVRSG